MSLRGCLAVILTIATSAPAFGQSVPAGRVKVVSGMAFVVRERRPVPAKIGEPVYEADGLTTGADGRIGVTLRDGTRLSLGPGSEVRLDRFLYAPAQGQLGFVLNVLRGLVAYASGHIAKLSPDAVRLETPTAIVGVRGTRLMIQVASP